MARTFLASVANAEAFVMEKNTLGNDELKHVLSAKTLTDSTLGFTSTTEEVRGGVGAKLYGRFVHTTGMTVQLTDAMFDIDYIRYQIGAQRSETGNTVIYSQNDHSYSGTEIKDAGGFTLDFAPKPFGVSCGLDKVAIWLHPVGCGVEYDEVTLIIGQNCEFATTTEGGETVIVPNKVIVTDPATKDSFSNDVQYCVSYIRASDNAEMYKVLAEFNPAQMILILSANLYVGDANNPETGSKWGTFVVKIPRFQLDGTFDLSMAMTSAASMSLTGSALAVDDGTCEGKGVYAEIVINEDGDIRTENFSMIAIDPEYNKVNQIPHVYGLKKNGGAILLDNANLTFSPGLSGTGAWSSAASTTVTLTGTSLSDTIVIQSAS